MPENIGYQTNPVLEALEEVSAMTPLDETQRPRLEMLEELLTYCKQFIKDSRNWRQSSFENDWALFQRNSDGIYDPAIKNRKEGWQSKAFVPITPAHRENIHAALFRMIVGARPMLEMRARIEQPNDQSENVRDLILRDMEKTRFEVEINKVLDDATTYGSGFCRIRHEDIKEERKVRSPMRRAVDVLDPQNVQAAFNGNQPVDAFEDTIQEVQVFKGTRMEHLSIWDIFPDPKALTIKGSTIAYRYFQTLGDIVEGVSKGFYFPEALHKVKGGDSEETQTDDKQVVDTDRNMAPSTVVRPEYGKRRESFELFARLPKKWVLVRGEEIDDPDKLIAARVQFTDEAVLTVDVSDEYDGEAPIYKMDYFPVSGRFYARGIPEMLAHIQEVVNETVNQRIDNISLILNKMFGVIEKGLVDRADLVSKPGQFIRLDARYVQDVRQAIMAIEIPDVTNSAYADVQEMERYAQERTSSNRVTLGTSGLVNDQNKTLGGMELVKESATEKFAYIGMLMEFSFLYQTFRAFWKTIYANIQPQEVIEILGPERALKFELMTPEDIESKYIYEPQGIFTMENKALTQARLRDLYLQYADQPWLDRMGFFDKQAQANNLEPESLKLSPQDMVAMMQAQMDMQMAQNPPKGMPSKTEEKET